MKTGETAHVKLASLTLEGEGVAQLEGRAVLCRGAFPGEEAEVRLEALSRHHARAHARLVRVLAPHPARRTAPCPNHASRAGRCTGCPLMELTEPAQREAKRTMLHERYGLEVAHVEPAPAQLGYRLSSKRVVGSVRGALTLGSYTHGSHRFAAMPGCLVDHPRLVAAFAAVEAGARALGIAPYEEATALGDLRYVWAKTNGREVIVTLVSARAESGAGELATWLSRHDVQGVLHSVQPSRGNALRGAPAVHVAGQRGVAIALLGQHVEVGALGFVQPNPAVAEAAYRALTESAQAEPRRLAFDLYAGAGITTRALAERFDEVVACEAHPESARALGIEAESVEAFLTRVLARDEPARPDLVIANPPRKGLGDEVCRALLSLGAPRLHVMSCGPEGLARDLAQLAARYDLASLEAFDTLPQTAHVELVARLSLR